VAGGDSHFDASAFEQSLEQREPRRWIGWRLRALVLAAMLGCGVVFVLMRSLAISPHLDAAWQPTARGQLTLLASPVPALAAVAGRTLEQISAPGHPAAPLRPDELMLQRTARWLVDDAQRERFLQQQQQLSALLAQGQVRLSFSDGSTITVDTPARGTGGLGLLFWPFTAFALLLYLVGWGVLLLRPGLRNGLYALMVWCQALNLLLIGAENVRGLGLPPGFAGADLMLRLTLDVITAATAACAYALHPRRLPHARLIIAAVAAAAAAWALAAHGGWLPQLWRTTQVVVLGLGAAATAVIAWSYRIAANPFVAVMRRFTSIAVGTLALVSIAVALSQHLAGAAPGVAAVAAVIWYLFLASLLLLVPFLSRSRRVLREFALVAGIGTVASSLDLIFVALFALGPLASLMLALALGVAVYVVARQWILNRMVGASVLTTERTFEQLYRVAREVQDHPERTPHLLARLLHDLFEPLEMLWLPHRLPAARVVGAGAALYVPLPGEPAGPELNQVLVMRHASHGKRIFTDDDAQLAERVVEQVLRAVAYDRAVERGRTEERQRIAQDLHDDIGARLLTLMYKAGDREIEDYIRHTLQDLKTLTRGLAATEHRLSHAVGEWKADLQQRLQPAQLQLRWSVQTDRDLPLTVSQWSGLTRILRELVSNAIYHADATQVEVQLQLEGGTLKLRVADDGKGGDPATWSHGLGLGGVRKRVRALGGQVQWKANGERGIACEVTLPGFGGAASSA
jgi:signal transduction histidine kinase